MNIKNTELLLLFKKMYCDDLKIMNPVDEFIIDIAVNNKHTFNVTYQRMKKNLTCICEMIVDSHNQLIHVKFLPIIQTIDLDNLILPGVQCIDELNILYNNLSILLSHPELSQEYTLTYNQLELLYKLFITN